MTTTRKPTLIEAFIPIIFLMIALFVNVFYVFGDEGLQGSNQMILIFSTAIASLMAMRLGMKWEDMLKGMTGAINSALPSILILLLIGSLAGTWLLSGIVPAMIFYGLKILNPTIFLFASCIVCALVSLASGSSWSTVATIGIALLGIGRSLGISDGLIAGAIISGAYFGDKMSPLSDTTNLAPAVAGTDLFTHIRYMALTTIPSITIALIIFLVLGFTIIDSAPPTNVENILKAIEGTFNINIALFLVPVVVIVMIVKKVPAIPALLTGIVLGAVFALIFQQDVLKVITKDTSFSFAAYKSIMQAMFGDIKIITSNIAVDELLVTGGMAGMLNTIWLIITAMLFGGTMESSGMLKTITQAIISKVESTGSLIASTAGTCLFFNATTSDQYMAIVVPGRMFADTFKAKGLEAENLSRTLEDSGTVTSVLVPWNTCGATQAGVLGVTTGTYLPYCFFNIISPIMTILFAFLNIKIRRIKQNSKKKK